MQLLALVLRGPDGATKTVELDSATALRLRGAMLEANRVQVRRLAASLFLGVR